MGGTGKMSDYNFLATNLDSPKPKKKVQGRRVLL